jgi:hypothetical protein
MLIKKRAPLIARERTGMEAALLSGQTIRKPDEAWPFTGTARAHFGRPRVVTTGLAHRPPLRLM